MKWLVAVILGGLACARMPAADLPHHFVLEVDMALERGGEARVFCDFGDGIWRESPPAARVPPGLTPQTVRLQLPTQPIRALRFDPTSDDQPAFVTQVRLLTDRGELLNQLHPALLRPLENVSGIGPYPVGTGWIVQTRGRNPQVQFPVPLQQKMNRAMQRPVVTRNAVLLLAFAVGALTLAVTIIAWRALASSATARFGSLALFCLVLGFRLAELNGFSRAVPFWDEWDGDALYILMPYQGGFLDWGALFMPQWEHRILLTRLITLGGTILNGEWDVRVAMTVSAVMFAAAVALIAAALIATRRTTGAIAALVLAAGAALPFDFNNLLWGGQTQMYGLFLLAACIFGLASASRITPAVLIAALPAGLVSLFTMGAGPVAPGCAVGICLVRAWLERDQRRRLAGLAGLFFVVALLGVGLHSSSPQHVPLYATKFAQFRHAFLGVMAWPLPPRVICALLLWLPAAINGGLILRRRTATPLEWLAVGFGAWGFVNAVALGYARPYEGPPFDSRFFTPLALGAIGSAGASVALALRAPAWQIRAWPLAAAAAIAAGLLQLGVSGIDGARESYRAHAEFDRRIRLMLSTGDRTPVVEKPPAFNGNAVADRLESSLLRPILPAPLRRAIGPLAPGDPGATSLEAGPITLTVRTMMKGGLALAALGLLGYGWFLRRLFRERAAPGSPL